MARSVLEKCLPGFSRYEIYPAIGNQDLGRHAILAATKIRSRPSPVCKYLTRDIVSRHGLPCLMRRRIRAWSAECLAPFWKLPENGLIWVIEFSGRRNSTPNLLYGRPFRAQGLTDMRPKMLHSCQQKSAFTGIRSHRQALRS